jgi:membrane-bound metal-dependent hydrolase YbcI (DUF457 family)
MPSPVGHALGGIAAGWGLTPARNLRTVVVLAAAGGAADLDLLVGSHRGPTHSIGAVLVTFAVVAVWTRSAWWGSALSAAWGSHVLLDWLGTDTTAPFGEMALWPLTRGYYESGLHLFPAISRRYWLPEFWTFSLKALAIELVILGPLVWVVTRRKDHRN